jgi:hypothetical protein
MVSLHGQLAKRARGILSSALVSSISSHDDIACQNYFSIFSVIQRDRGRLFRGECYVDVFNVAEDAVRRCIFFTGGYGAVGLLQALDHLFCSSIDIWTAEITHARRTTPLTQPGPPAATGGDLEYLDYANEELLQVAHRCTKEHGVIYGAINTERNKADVLVSPHECVNEQGANSINCPYAIRHQKRRDF